MKAMLVRLIVVMLAVICVISVTPRPADAIWQILLDEHFEEDQENPQLKWPWYTDLRAGEVPKRWYWNALLPYNRGVQGQPQRHVWGLQDYIFNSRIRRDDKQALWCAYTNNNNVDNPHWPKEENYIKDQKAWVWWGPFSMAEMTNCIISYWVYLDLKQYSYDSLSVIIVNEDQIMLDFDNPNAWRSQVGFGCVGWNPETKKPIKSTHANKIDQWQRYQFTLDSLLVNDQWTSYAGRQEDLFVAFVWQTDGYDIQGKGAFIDDIMVVMDDGLFDLLPTTQYFGYNVTADSMKWIANSPRAGDEVQFAMDWTALGNGLTPPFDITCTFDNQVIHTERVQEEAIADAVYRVTVPDVWTAVPGNHTVTWKVDTRNEVRETIEINNMIGVNFEVLWNPAPNLKVTEPNGEGVGDIDSIPYDEKCTVTYTVNDSNDFDNEFYMNFFLAEDTSGIGAVPERIWNPDQFIQVGMVGGVGRGEQQWVWNLQETWDYGQIDTFHVYYIIAVALDSDPLNLSISVAPARVAVLPLPNRVGTDRGASIREYGLNQAYPNPFNSRLQLEYALEQGDNVQLQIFDLSGREVATLANGYSNPGKHTATWRPVGLSGGMYIARLTVGNTTYNKKVVYLP